MRALGPFSGNGISHEGHALPIALEYSCVSS